jgi:hypothetical protein
MVGACGVAGSNDHGVPTAAMNGPAGRAAWDWGFGGGGLFEKNMGDGGVGGRFFANSSHLSPQPFGSIRSSGFDRSLHSLHRWVGFHLIRSLIKSSFKLSYL